MYTYIDLLYCVAIYTKSTRTRIIICGKDNILLMSRAISFRIKIKKETVKPTTTTIECVHSFLYHTIYSCFK